MPRQWARHPSRCSMCSPRIPAQVAPSHRHRGSRRSPEPRSHGGCHRLIPSRLSRELNTEPFESKSTKGNAMAISSVLINVADVDRSVDFYTRFLGLEPVEKGPEGAVLDAVAATI